VNEPANATQEQMDDLQDELHWDELFQRTQSQLATAARRARQQIAAGKASPTGTNQHGGRKHERL
jgi:hypothetical protein